MDTKGITMMIVSLVIGVVLITGIVVPVINGLSNSGDNGEESANDVIYYMAPGEGTHTITLEKGEVQFTDPDHDNEDWSTAYGTVTIKVDDVVVKEIEWRNGTTVDSTLFTGTIPLAFGEKEVDSDGEGTMMDLSYGYFLSVQYVNSGCWTDNTYTTVKEYYFASILYNTYMMMSIGGEQIGTSTDSTDLSENTLTIVDGVVEDSSYPITMMISASDSGDYGYAKTSIASIEDNIWDGYMYESIEYTSPADWTGHNAMCWFYGEPSNISLMAFDEGSGSSEGIATFTPTLDSNGYVNVHVVYDDDHVADFVIDHALVPADNISAGDSGGSGSDNDTLISILSIIPLIMIIGLVITTVGYFLTKKV